MSNKKLGYVLLGAALFLSGFWLYNNKNKSKKEGSSVSSDTIPQNDATKAGMPYSIDVAKITKGNDNNIYYLAPNGVQYWVSNIGNDGYYLDNGMDADSPNPQYVYDLKTGAFLKLLKVI